jgi:hypothetical protein
MRAEIHCKLAPPVNDGRQVRELIGMCHGQEEVVGTIGGRSLVGGGKRAKRREGGKGLRLYILNNKYIIQ